MGHGMDIETSSGQGERSLDMQPLSFVYIYIELSFNHVQETPQRIVLSRPHPLWQGNRLQMVREQSLRVNSGLDLLKTLIVGAIQT